MHKARVSLIVSAALVALTMPACTKPTPQSTIPPPESVLRMKAACAEAGAKARQEWVAKFDRETFTDHPEYGYNGTLNTCLYADEYIDVNPGSRQPLLAGVASRRDCFVLDVYSGKVLLEYTEHDGKSIQTEADPVMCRSEAEFEARKEKLFGREPTSPLP